MLLKTSLRAAMKRRLLRFAADRTGNVGVLAALLIPSLILSMGATLDYISATHREERLNGIADAAALAAVTPNMMLQSTDVAKTTASNLFTSQASQVANVQSVPTPTITVVDTTTGASIIRTATVTYATASNNVFSGVLGFATMGIQGKAVAKSTLSPKTNFYLMIDTSPSMEIPATTAGINAMVALTQSGQGGCAFACHETNPTAGDVAGNPGGIDNYSLSRLPPNCISLRIDYVNDAVNNLIQVAPATATANNTVYGMEVDTFDAGFRNVVPLTTTYGFTANGFTVDGGCNATTIPNYIAITPMTIYSNNYAVKGVNNSDEDTLFDSALAQMSARMPSAGTGGSGIHDTPKEVLLIVSDAVPDYDNNGARTYVPINVALDTSLTTPVDWCTSIKNRGIRIAFLYLTYNPLPPTTADQWYTTYIAPDQSKIAPAAQACASTGLFFQVDTDGDITHALAALFQKAVATAYLSQ